MRYLKQGKETEPRVTLSDIMYEFYQSYSKSN